MGVIRHPRKIVIPTGASGSEQSTAPPTDDEASSVASGMSTPVPHVGGGRQLNSSLTPALLRQSIGYRLRMKQGRKSKQRFENEKLLMAMYGVDSEESTLGLDVGKDSRSYFSNLLNEENTGILEQFLNSEEAKYFNTQEEEDDDESEKAERRPETEVQAEEAFMRIGFGMRQALKRKNVPLGILRSIEEQLNGSFSQEPCEDFVCDSMTSFERLMVHALSAYNALNSYSFDREGRRVVRVQNPRSEFFKKDPLLSDFLLIRAAAS